MSSRNDENLTRPGVSDTMKPAVIGNAAATPQHARSRTSQGEAVMNSSEAPRHHRDRKQDLSRVLHAYFRHTASAVDDPARLEELLDKLCSSDETLLTDVQVELRRRQAQYIRNLLNEKERMDALHEVYFEAMDKAYAVGGAFYGDTAARLTDLEAEGYDALEHKQYQTFTQVLETIRTLGDRANHMLENVNAPGD